MTFIQSIETCFQKYGKLNGRASLSEYWWWQLFVFLAYFCVGIFEALLGYNPEEYTVFTMSLDILLLLPSICVAVRRCHDSSHSGWWVLCPVVSLVMMFLPSDPLKNEYDLV